MTVSAASRRAKVLVVGSGAREHALAFKLSLSDDVAEVIVAPGNAGMPFTRWDESVGDVESLQRLARRAAAEKVNLAVIGPDALLAMGAVDCFRAFDVPCFGPDEKAAEIESSKAFAKEIMLQAGIPTARAHVFESEREAIAFLDNASISRDEGWVVKADGLALGKGVVLPETVDEARAAVRALFPISRKLVVEERLKGEEVSVIALCDGERAALFEPVRDYKRVFDGGKGPNTGGMGAVTPVPGYDREFLARVHRDVFLPALSEMKRRGRPFRGALFAGLMVDGDRIRVLEFNARFGDPETQVIVHRMKADLFTYLDRIARGESIASLTGENFVMESCSCAVVAVVAAAKGYPERVEKGARLPKTDWEPGTVFFAGVESAATGEPSALQVSGGRVASLMGQGDDIAHARNEAYRRVEKLRFDGMHFRSDIAAEMLPGGAR